MNDVKYNEGTTERRQYILSPVDGEIIKESQIIDKVFQEKLFGEYVCIHPKSRKLLSPVSGIIEKIEKYEHYIIIRSDLGTKIWIYLGAYAISLDGRYTKVVVSEGDKVNAGDVLIICDFEEIERLGYEIKIIMSVINQDNILDVISLSKEDVKGKDKILVVIFAMIRDKLRW
ncbi:PTS glucose transporter subunit IIA [Clostridium sp. YIM B02555]|uniref:PTS glucose transporter subunit IIA n=1 Tax=Clostridium sp. YIM B02555 TaxID=2911968 RepID=UPI001EED963E|nr:PTS glucose transporter subunit IIA [Clostridium sp. YIM B02555]